MTEAYAKTQWTADDVLTLRPNMTREEAENFLSLNEKHITARLIELGWEVIETLLPATDTEEMDHWDDADYVDGGTT